MSISVRLESEPLIYAPILNRARYPLIILLKSRNPWKNSNPLSTGSETDSDTIPYSAA